MMFPNVIKKFLSNSKSTRTRTAKKNASSYELLEPRKLMAGDLGDSLDVLFTDGDDNTDLSHFVAGDGTLFFSNSSLDINFQGSVFRSDGVSVDVVEQFTTGTKVTDLETSNGLIFIGTDTGRLWVSSGYGLGEVDGPGQLNGSSNTFELDVDFGASASNLGNFIDVNGTMFFTVQLNSGIQLWKSDGTSAGTLQVDPGESVELGASINPVDVDGQLFFFGEKYLYRTNGESIEEVMSVDAMTGEFDRFSIEANGNLVREVSAAVVNGSLFFSINNTSTNGLYRVNVATDSGSTPETNFNIELLSRRPGEDDDFVTSINSLTEVNGTLFFQGSESDSTPNSGNRELWRSDGTIDGTVQVVDVVSGDQDFRYDPSLTNVNGTLFFKVSNGAGAQLWRTDGSAGGTRRVEVRNQLGEYVELKSVTNLHNHDGILVFAADDRAIWATNGSQHFQVGSLGSAGEVPAEFVDVNERLFFTTDLSTSQSEANEQLLTIPGLPISPVTPADIQPIEDANGVIRGQVQRVAVPDFLTHPNYVDAPGVDLTDLAAVGVAFTMELEPTGGTNDSGDWQVIPGLEGFSDPVIVATVSNVDARGRGGVRIRGGGSFWEIQFDEWDGQNPSHGIEFVNLVVVEAGIHQLEDGTKIVAQYATVSDQPLNVSLQGAFATAPVVVSQLVSAPAHGSDPAQPAASRVSNVTSTSFDVRLQVQEAPGVWDGVEQTVAVIAIEQGLGDSNQQKYEVANGIDASNFNTKIDYSTSFTQAPITVVATQSFTEADPFHIRWKQTPSLANERFVFFLQEEKSADSEVAHAPEDYGYFSFDEGTIFGTANFDLIGPSYVKATPEPETISPISNISSNGDSNPTNLTDVDGVVYFTATPRPGRGAGLYRSVFDNEAQSFVTCRVATVGDSCNLPGGQVSYVTNAENLTSVDGRLYYTANGGLFVLSDNTSQSFTTAVTQNVTNFQWSNYSNLHESNGKLFFTAAINSLTPDSDRGVELAVIDQYGASPRVFDLADGFSSSFPHELTTVNNVLYFAADSDGDGRNSLFKTYGNTEFVLEANDQYGSIANVNPENLIDVDGTLYFTGSLTAEGENEARTFLWYIQSNSDDTSTQAYRVSEVFEPAELTNVRGRLYFTSVLNEQRRLFVTDGTVSSIAEVAANALENETYGEPSNLTESNGFLFFESTKETGQSSFEHSIWGLDPSNPFFEHSDGDVDLRGAIKLSKPADLSGDIGGLTDVNGTLFFYRETSDGTTLMKINDDGARLADGTNEVQVAGDALWWERLVEEPVSKRDGNSENGVFQSTNFLSANGNLYYAGFADEIGVQGVELKVVGDHLTCVEIGDRVWIDSNGDGIQNDGDSALALAVSVRLVEIDDNGGESVVLTTVPDEFGYYYFNARAGAEYQIEFELPFGYTFTIANIGNDDGLDSDVELNGDGRIGRTTQFVADFSRTLTWDAGVVAVPSFRLGGAWSALVATDLTANRRSVVEPIEKSGRLLVRKQEQVPQALIEASDSAFEGMTFGPRVEFDWNSDVDEFWNDDFVVPSL